MSSHDNKDVCARAVQSDQRWSEEPPGYGWVCDLETVRQRRVGNKSVRVVEVGNLRFVGQVQGDDAYRLLRERYEAAVLRGDAKPLEGHSVDEGADRSEAEGGPGVAAASVSHSLEEKRKQCGEEREREPLPEQIEPETTYEARRCRCKNWFCDDCAPSMGIALRLRLIPIIETFTSVQMWTFTIDPTLFNSPDEAFEYFKSKRCLSNLMRALRDRGLVHSSRFFSVIEWHKNGYAHWHVLIDASYVPKKIVQEVWDKYRPEWAGPKPDDRPGFGMVRFSKRKFSSKLHAARYATKYLIKPPESGYPDWVLDYGRYVRRYSTSNGFWESSKGETKSIPTSKEADPDGHEENVRPKKERDPGEVRSTIRERLARCGQQTVLLANHIKTHHDGTREYSTQFLGQLRFVSFHDAKAFFGFEDFCLKVIPLTSESVTQLILEDKKRQLNFRLEVLALKGEARRAA